MGCGTQPVRVEQKVPVAIGNELVEVVRYLRTFTMLLHSLNYLCWFQVPLNIVDGGGWHI